MTYANPTNRNHNNGYVQPDNYLNYLVALHQLRQQVEKLSPLPAEVMDILSDYPGTFDVLDNSLVIYVPTTVDVNVAADNSKYVEQTKAFMAKLFDGNSSVEKAGQYDSPVHGIVPENVMLVKSFMTRTALCEYLPQVLDFVAYLQKELRQESIGLEINGKMVLANIQVEELLKSIRG
jgi:hypothetical protein